MSAVQFCPSAPENFKLLKGLTVKTVGPFCFPHSHSLPILSPFCDLGSTETDTYFSHFFSTHSFSKTKNFILFLLFLSNNHEASCSSRRSSAEFSRQYVLYFFPYLLLTDTLSNKNATHLFAEHIVLSESRTLSPQRISYTDILHPPQNFPYLNEVTASLSDEYHVITHLNYKRELLCLLFNVGVK